MLNRWQSYIVDDAWKFKLSRDGVLGPLPYDSDILQGYSSGISI